MQFCSQPQGVTVTQKSANGNTDSLNDPSTNWIAYVIVYDKYIISDQKQGTYTQL